MAEEIKGNRAGAVSFSEMETDAMGEILNISMGSAATAVSELLNAKVWITTPRVSVRQVKELSYQKLEPAIAVKIIYTNGISGSNIMVLKQDDVQLMLNQLMGMPMVVTEDFVFDELNISAVSEVMNQMMGASATALSNFLGLAIDISTPETFLLENATIAETSGMQEEDDVVAVNFDLTIDGVIKSEFISIMEIELARDIAQRMLGGHDADPAPAPAPKPEPKPAPAPSVQEPPTPSAQPQQAPGYPPYGAGQYAPPQMPQMQQMPSQYPYDPAAYPPQYPPYGYPPQPYPPYTPNAQPSVNVQPAKFESFDTPSALSAGQQDNLQLLMSVPLEITVEIGSAKRKVKDILEFTQGTIIELERQAGAPVDVIVNGNLIARGDVVVIDDNFAVRITDIVKSKFLDTLGNKE